MAENDQIPALTPKQERLIEALLTGHNITLSAKASGVADKTARRWLKLPHFQQAYKAAQKRLFDQALTGLMLKIDRAIETLDRHMSGEETPANVQVRAAQIVLEQAIIIHKVSELEAKFTELEQLIKSPLQQAGRH